jgi:hypothetical protein
MGGGTWGKDRPHKRGSWSQVITLSELQMLFTIFEARSSRPTLPLVDGFVPGDVTPYHDTEFAYSVVDNDLVCSFSVVVKPVSNKVDAQVN